MTNQAPENSWKLYLETVEKADNLIGEIQAGKPMGPLLNQILHLLAFQQGVCVARWVNQNRELIERLNAVQSFTKEEFEEIASDIRKSVEKLVRL